MYLLYYMVSSTFFSALRFITLVIFSTLVIGAQAQQYQYARINLNAHSDKLATGSGTWQKNTVLSSFSINISSDNGRIAAVATTLGGQQNEVDKINVWETKYGEINATTTNCIKVRSNSNNAAIGAALRHPIVTKITFHTPTTSTGWGILFLDIDAEQVQIKAKDANGNEYASSVINSWFKEAFNMSNDNNPTNYKPCWNAATKTLVGPFFNCKRQNELSSYTDGTGSAAYFEPNSPISEIEFIFDNLQSKTGEPSQRYFIAAKENNLFQGNIIHDAQASFSGRSTNVSVLPNNLFIHLFDTIGNFKGSTKVAQNGTFEFKNLDYGNYFVQLSDQPNLNSKNNQKLQLGDNWVYLGSYIAAVQNSLVQDGMGFIRVDGSNNYVENINFSIEQKPIAHAKSYRLNLKPQRNQVINLSLGGDVSSGNVPGNLTGLDPEDGVYNSTNASRFAVKIVTAPTHGTLKYNGINITAGQVINAYQADLLTFSFDGYSLSPYSATEWSYAVIDAAGIASEPVVYAINWDESLPIQLVKFEGKMVANNAYLSWVTAKEIDNQGFVVERSTNGYQWEEIEFIASQASNGNNSALLKYDYTDEQPTQGQNLYRLKQVDFSGQFEYSNIIKLVTDQSMEIALYPNPCNSILNIRHNAGAANVWVIDINGKLIWQSAAANDQLQINVNGWTQGTYFILVQKDQETIIKLPFIVQL